MSEIKKHYYEKPISVDAGKVASILGLVCSTGEGADEGCAVGNAAAGGCVAGTDPHVVPACTPGLTASFYCSVGTTNSQGNCEVGNTARGCYTGDAP